MNRPPAAGGRRARSQTLIRRRQAELIRRLEQIEQANAAGESSSTSVELALLADEIEFLRRLTAELVDEAELRLIERNIDGHALELILARRPGTHRSAISPRSSRRAGRSSSAFNGPGVL